MMSLPVDGPVTVVLGLGNPVRYDDAVGLRTAEEVARLLEADPVPGVRVAISTRAGFELVDLLTGAARAIIIDCLAPAESRPGRIHRLTPENVAGSTRLIGAHDVSVGDALALARVAGVPMPETIEIYAVEVGDIDRIEEGLSPDVARAVPTLARRIHRQLMSLPGTAVDHFPA
jgi:hydrogenase maturation protease